jgi:hypothetical protein
MHNIIIFFPKIFIDLKIVYNDQHELFSKHGTIFFTFYKDCKMHTIYSMIIKAFTSKTIKSSPTLKYNFKNQNMIFTFFCYHFFLDLKIDDIFLIKFQKYLNIR